MMKARKQMVGLDMTRMGKRSRKFCGLVREGVFMRVGAVGDVGLGSGVHAGTRRPEVSPYEESACRFGLKESRKKKRLRRTCRVGALASGAFREGK